MFLQNLLWEKSQRNGRGEVMKVLRMKVRKMTLIFFITNQVTLCSIIVELIGIASIQEFYTSC